MPSNRERRRYAATGIYMQLPKPKIIDKVVREDGMTVIRLEPMVPKSGDIKRMSVSRSPRLAKMTGRHEPPRKAAGIKREAKVVPTDANPHEATAAQSGGSPSKLFVKHFVIKPRKPTRGVQK